MGKIVTAYASAARTATPTAVTVPAGRYNYMNVTVNATAITATPSVVVTIDAYDPVSGTYVNMLTSAAITATGTTLMRIGPTLAAVANLAANHALPGTVRITCTHGDADSITYSVGVELMD